MVKSNLNVININTTKYTVTVIDSYFKVNPKICTVRLKKGDKYDIAIAIALAHAYNASESKSVFTKYCNKDFNALFIKHKTEIELKIKVALSLMYKYFGSKDNYHKQIQKVLKQVLNYDGTVEDFNKEMNEKINKETNNEKTKLFEYKNKEGKKK